MDVLWHLISYPPSSWEIQGGLNLALGLVTSCYSQMTLRRRPKCLGVGGFMGIIKENKMRSWIWNKLELPSLKCVQSRCVQAGDNDLWCRVSQLMDHSDERKVRGEWNMFQLDVVDFVRKRCFLQNKISQVWNSYNYNALDWTNESYYSEAQ